MKAPLAALLAFLGLAAAAAAKEEVVAGLSQNTVSITANFDGTEILIFGAVKREAPPPAGAMQIIVTIEGPKQELVVRRKARRFGIWVNADAVDVDAAPSFYAVATSAPWAQTVSDTEDLRWKISIPRAIRSVGAVVSDSPSFTEALIRIRASDGIYQFLPGTVQLDENVLFSTAVRLPANLIEGNYRARIFLTRNGRVVDEHSAEIDVRKSGLERWLYRLSQEQPLAYGILAIVIAISAGWAASAAFRYMRS
jgi:uncharacterized protein (TIGR02186 family)